MHKRGQFFILASVILSVLLLSMAFTTNYVIAHSADKSFFDYADSIERESNYVLDYEIYSGLSRNEMEDFISILEADYKDRQVGANFMFIYGNASLLNIKNLGTQGITIEGETAILEGATTEIESRIGLGGFSGASVFQYSSGNTQATVTGLTPGQTLDIEFNEYVYKFPVSSVNQVIFIIQKDVGDETYVEVR